MKKLDITKFLDKQYNMIKYDPKIMALVEIYDIKSESTKMNYVPDLNRILFK